MMLNALSARIGDFAWVPGTLQSCQPAAWNQTSMSPPCRMPVRRPRCNRRLRSNRSANQCCQFGGASNGTFRTLNSTCFLSARKPGSDLPRPSPQDCQLVQRLPSWPSLSLAIDCRRQSIRFWIHCPHLGPAPSKAFSYGRRYRELSEWLLNGRPRNERP